MRALAVLITIAISATLRAESIHVDGVLVRGRVHDVSASDIRNAIDAVSSKVSQVVVLSADKLHVYLKPADLGWVAVRNYGVTRPKGSLKWGSDWLCVDDPQVLQLIRTADEDYIFPVATPDNPHRASNHLRRLDDGARGKLVRLLGNHDNWYQGGYSMLRVAPEPRNIGLLFRHGRNELVLFLSSSFTASSGLATGVLDGQHVCDRMLEEKPGKKMEEWTRQYAQSELVAR
jgi:hypothetical protein